MDTIEFNYYVTPDEYEIAEALGISKDLVDKRIRLYTWPKKMAISIEPKQVKKYDNSIKDLLKVNGISEGTFYKRIKYGWSVERACTEPVNLRRDIINKMACMRRRKING
ncbi:hypothetical protein GKZ28_00920 [Clostridium chromiireducens]|uniref:Uncharacterized protein n=1 Tax=Clostridium chromiireducens TaxID=225345 RepID=A0A964RIQ5_9CLOT|nr:hypothetical protein [Clostridium chromiireducens]MVX62261.1 hypothetical protein [Clostridium chromiireducens]